MQLHDDEAGPSHCVEVEESVNITAADAEKIDAIFTCKFPGCTRQYASTDGVRKHCRKSHPEWLREVDLDKANHGCRWAAYCTREAITEGYDPRTTPVGSKRAREMLAQGGALPPTSVSGLSSVLKSTGTLGSTSSFGAASTSSRDVSFGVDGDEQPLLPPPRHEPKVPKHAPHMLAMDGKSALVPHRPMTAGSHRSSVASENLMPPEMITLPGELHTPLPSSVSNLTPNAQARQRLGEIADSESLCLAGGTMAPPYPSSPVIDAPPLQQSNSFFTQWGMPPLKRGLSLADTREAAAVSQSMVSSHSTGDLVEEASVSQVHDSPSFLDSFLA